MDAPGPRPLALVLAAGFSSRMRAFKPLLALADGYTPLGAVCSLYAALDIPVLVVCGYRGDEVARAAARLGARSVRNPRPEAGMFSSVLTGLTDLPASVTHIFVHPVDMPLVRPLTPRLLLRAAGQHPVSPLVPNFLGRTGHPPLLPAAAVAHIRDWTGADGLRGALDSLPPALAPRAVPVPDRFCRLDTDTPEDLETARALWPQRAWLRPDEALELLRIWNLPAPGLAHARAVGRVAEVWARRLQTRHPELALNAELAHSGGLLHDLCKGAPRHEQAAGACLRELGLPVLARLVESHQDLTLPAGETLTERELVYLADKHVQGDRLVPLAGRYAAKLDRYAGNAEACAAIRGRLERARDMEARCAALLEAPPARLAAEALAD